jgi:hypothetical protein
MRILAMTAAAALLIGTIAVQAQENDKRPVGTEGAPSVENGGGSTGGNKAMAPKKMTKHHKSSKNSSKM